MIEVPVVHDNEEEVEEVLEDITITVNVPERLKLGDFKKFDKMFSNKAGAFSEGLELLQSWVSGVDLDDLFPEELEMVWKAVQEELDRKTDRKNSTKNSRRILSKRQR
jgi:hypothetical protein